MESNNEPIHQSKRPVFIKKNNKFYVYKKEYLNKVDYKGNNKILQKMKFATPYYKGKYDPFSNDIELLMNTILAAEKDHSNLVCKIQNMILKNYKKQNFISSNMEVCKNINFEFLEIPMCYKVPIIYFKVKPDTTREELNQLISQIKNEK